MPHSVQLVGEDYAMTTKKQLVRKILKAKRELLTGCLQRIQELLDQSTKLKDEESLKRFNLHHLLLFEAHTLETVLTPTDKSKIVINGIRNIAEDLRPTDNLRMYS